MWVTTAPGWIGIFDWLRNRLQFHGRWRVDVYARDAQGQGQGCVLSSQAANRQAAGDLVAQLAGRLETGDLVPGADPAA
jgi:hypothetical protein